MELTRVLIVVVRPSIEQFARTRSVIGLPRRSHHRYAIFVSLNKRHILSCISHKMLLSLRIRHILKRHFFRLLMLQPLLLSEVHTVMVLINKWFLEVTVPILSSNLLPYLIIIKIRGTFVLLLLFVSVRIPTFHLLRVLESNVGFGAKFVRRDALCAIDAFVIRSWSFF